jgi:hypothetical protein
MTVSVMRERERERERESKNRAKSGRFWKELWKYINPGTLLIDPPFHYGEYSTKTGKILQAPKDREQRTENSDQSEESQ